MNPNIQQLPQDIDSWAAFLSKAEIPVLKATARELKRLQEDDSQLSVRNVASFVMHDPMMAFRLLRYMQTHKSRHQLQDLVLVEQAIMMMGTNAFFQNLPPQPLVEEMLKDNLPALAQMLRLIRRAYRAANYAFDWAIHLKDLHAEEVRIAAFLHDVTETLMWCFAPGKMMHIHELQAADKTLRSFVAQEQVLDFKLADLQNALVEICQLPPLLAKLTQDHFSSDQRVRNVTLAVNLARHSANGWDDAALPDDYRDIAELLRMDVDKVMRIAGAPAPEPMPAQ